MCLIKGILRARAPSLRSATRIRHATTRNYAERRFVNYIAVWEERKRVPGRHALTTAFFVCVLCGFSVSTVLLSSCISRDESHFTGVLYAFCPSEE